jgi:eukaryotic-like serine/threonine-protein kinase
MLKPQTLLAGRYLIERQIDKGGMNLIYIAKDLRNPEIRIAVKEFDASKDASKDNAGQTSIRLQMLKQEALLLSKIHHPNIVDIKDVIATKTSLCVVTEYLEGKTLQKLIAENGALSEETTLSYLRQMCSALAYLHSQKPPIIYRDMKPGNCMVLPDGTLKLLDLGIAREYKANAQTNQDTIAFGTLGYAPPEQYGNAQTDARADIYALGVSVWHMLSGNVPPHCFPLPNLSTAAPAASAVFERLIKKCTQPDPDNRFQSIEELRTFVEQESLYESATEDTNAQDSDALLPNSNAQVSAPRSTGSNTVSQAQKHPRNKDIITKEISPKSSSFSFIIKYEEIVVHAHEKF